MRVEQDAVSLRDHEPIAVAPQWSESGAVSQDEELAAENAESETARQPSQPLDNPTTTPRGVEKVYDSGSVRKPRRRWVWAIAILLAIAVAGAGYRFWGRNSTAPQTAAKSGQPSPGVPVQAAEAQKSSIPIYLNSLGTVQALNTVTVRSRVDGQIMKIAFTEGEVVKAGDLLAQIDPRPYQAALDQALAKKQQDEATLANTKTDLERFTKLGDYATRQQVDTQRSSVGSQTAQIAFDQAAIENAQTQLDYATIRAPISGRTGLRLIDQGNIVHASDTTGIVDIAQIQPIAVLFTAPEDQLPEIAKAKASRKVAVTALNSDGQTVLGEGDLALINNQVDAASGTVRLKAQFPNADDRLWPGLSINTRLLLRTLDEVVTVPAEAIQRGQNQLFVYVVKPDDTAEKRVVKVGVFSEGKAVIEDGLKSGEKIVTSGQYRVVAGGRLQVTNPGPAPQDGDKASAPERTAAK